MITMTHPLSRQRISVDAAAQPIYESQGWVVADETPTTTPDKPAPKTAKAPAKTAKAPAKTSKEH